MTGCFTLRREQLRFDVVTTDRLLEGPDETLREAIEHLVGAAFPTMSEPDRSSYVNDFFTKPGHNLTRKGILFRTKDNGLVAVAIWDQGAIEYHRQTMETVYLISFMVQPEYQGFGLGQFIAAKVLTELAPDLLLVTCDQSASLYAWINLPGKGLVKDFEVYPRLLDHKEIMFLPLTDIDLVVRAFRQIYLGVADGRAQSIDGAINNLTVRMVRKNLHRPMFDFDPWERNGRRDEIASALGLTDRDGVLVVFKKLPSGHS